MMKFYMTPGSCSTGIHILLEELELVFEVYVMNMLRGDLQQPDYLAINPKGTIPTLVCNDGQALTDYQSIAWWLARSYPKKQFIPTDLEGEVKTLELMSYAVNRLHGQGFTRIFTADRYSKNEQEQALIKQQGKEIVKNGFDIIDKNLTDNEYLLESFTIADTALFYNEFWADRIGVELPTKCRKHYETMLSRPKVRGVLMEEGYSSVFS
ncbi:MAG: glutathione S-transferase N-terminal domain-containing protein [Pseudomonadales bacterium]|nr:glutathione S-transferase N-terminal domain-containing protein [Pseudomonadales bacterium]